MLVQLSTHTTHTHTTRTYTHAQTHHTHHTHIHTRTDTPHTRTHTPHTHHTHTTRTYTYTHARAHTHTHTWLNYYYIYKHNNTAKFLLVQDWVLGVIACVLGALLINNKIKLTFLFKDERIFHFIYQKEIKNKLSVETCYVSW